MVLREAVDDRSEGFAQARLGAMLKAQERSAVGGSATGLHLLDDGVGGDVARGHVAAVLAHAVTRGEFLALAVEQTPAELVAKRIPHDGIHADEARRRGAEGKERPKPLWQGG